MLTVGRSPLQEACRYGHSEIARLLLAQGAFLEHADIGGCTAFSMLWFQLSSQFCRAEFLKILLAYWPMPNALDLDGPVGPLACAAMKGSVEDLDLLMHTGVCVSNTAMIAKKIIKYSMLGSNLATSDYLMPLLPSGWINQTDQRGRGPLHVTLLCLGFHIKEIAQRLLVAGANVHLRDMDGNDPGDVARICDEQALSDGILQPASSGNVRAYYDALITEGFDVELDRDGILWWPSYDPTP